jgi:hypothetical protein
MNYSAKPYQSSFDAVISTTQDIRGYVNFCRDNDLNYDNTLTTGQIVEVSEIKLGIESASMYTATGEFTGVQLIYTQPKTESEILSVQDDQTLMDFVIWKYGDIRSFVKHARENEIKYDYQVYLGEIFIILQKQGNKKVVDFYRRNKIIPKSYFVGRPEGIGYMQIENDFIIT